MGCCCPGAAASGSAHLQEHHRAPAVHSEVPWDKMDGLKADDEVTDLGELSNGLQRMFRDVKVEALVKVDGPVLRMIELGSIALVRGKYLMHLAETGQPIPRRQDAPPTAFWPRDEAAKLFRRSQTEFRKPGPDLAGLLFLGLFLVAFSYCWITPDHPDPHCFHLKRIAAILRAMAKLRAGWNTYDDVGVFWDFLSLHQHCPHSGEKRSQIQSDHFCLALSGMQYIYAHDLTCVIKLQHMPPCHKELGEDGRFEALVDGEPKRLGWHYSDRGWPTFESALANLSRATQWSRLTFNDEALGLDGKAPPQTKNPPLLLDFRYKHVTNDPPLHPDTLSDLLLSKTFASGSDSVVVLDLYSRTFEKMCATKVLHFCTFYWPLQLCEHFGEALLAYDNLEHFNLIDGAIGDGRQGRSADPHALRALLRHLPTRTKLRHASYHDMRASAEDIEIFVTAMPPSLTSLGLPENPLRDKCATMLARVLPTQTPRLERLDFKGNYSLHVRFSKAAKEALQQAMPRCKIVY